MKFENLTLKNFRSIICIKLKDIVRRNIRIRLSDCNFKFRIV